MMKLQPIANALAFTGLVAVGTAVAGVKPDVPLLMVNAENGEGVVNIKNTDAVPIMLLTQRADLTEGQSNLITIQPPLVRIEAYQTQRVHFVLTDDGDLTTQQLQHFYFEGLPINGKLDHHTEVRERQSLQVIVNPKGLAINLEPWALLQWSMVNHQLTVKNDSPYVVRLLPGVRLTPGNQSLRLPRAYVLPGERLLLEPINKVPLSAVSKVTLSPISLYGDALENYTANVGQ
ncbi:fimbria/pilus chaperone family protein [Serratia proteamaculans]|uniref:Fimbria/pilus periplasmic chaperone n=1 Tax=Serratia proteamaculans TaxID=28151 RepID=A0A5Q2VI77_SERPR|nr:fimbria/pilus chaperone family protein [Serratia proteamaculans]QGH63916.1 fimbria/pilus periplasmic chaperone [Serratia proteamaculans]